MRGSLILKLNRARRSNGFHQNRIFEGHQKESQKLYEGFRSFISIDVYTHHYHIHTGVTYMFRQAYMHVFLLFPALRDKKDKNGW